MWDKQFGTLMMSGMLLPLSMINISMEGYRFCRKQDVWQDPSIPQSEPRSTVWTMLHRVNITPQCEPCFTGWTSLHRVNLTPQEWTILYRVNHVPQSEPCSTENITPQSEPHSTRVNSAPQGEPHSTEWTLLPYQHRKNPGVLPYKGLTNIW